MQYVDCYTYTVQSQCIRLYITGILSICKLNEAIHGGAVTGELDGAHKPICLLWE